MPLREPWRRRLRFGLRVLGGLVGVALLVGAFLVLRKELGHHAWREVVHELSRTSPIRIGLAFLAASISYASLIAHDLIAIRVLNIPVPKRRAVFAGFAAFAFANSLPFAVVSGAAVRSRFYASDSDATRRVPELVGFNTVTYAIGLLTATGLAFVLVPRSLSGVPIPLPLDSTALLGVACLSLVAAFLVWSAYGKPVIQVGKHRIQPTTLRQGLLRIGISMVDWCFSGLCLFALLPGSIPAGFLRYIEAFLLGEIAGLVSQLPGGIGVFEAVVVSLRQESGQVTGIFGALILYRAIYFALPLLLAVPLLLVREVRSLRRRKREKGGNKAG